MGQLSGDQSTGRLREVAWQEIFPGLLLLSTVRLARELPKLILAAAALLATVVGWRGLAYVFSGDPQTSLVIEQLGVTPWADEAIAEGDAAGSWIETAAVGAGMQGLLQPRDAAWLTHNPVLESWVFLSRPFRQLFDGNLNVSSVALLATCAIWTVTVWGLFGGAICRIAAVQLATGQRTGMRGALRFAAQRWPGYVWAPLLPLFLVALLVGGVSLLSWVARSDLGLAAVGVAWPLALLAGFVAAVVMLGLLFGWPLMWGAIGAEASDAFDAISRMYQYVYRRPLHYLGYWTAAISYGLLGWLLVAGFAAAAVYLAVWSASWAAGTERMAEVAAGVPPEAVMVRWPLPTPPAEAMAPAGAPGEEASLPVRIGIGALTFWVGAVKLLAIGFGFSYFWTATTAIYLLMRLHTDNKELDEVEQPGGPKRGLPPTTKDSAGVPLVADEPAQSPAAEREPSSDARATAPLAKPTEAAAAASNSVAAIDLTESRAENDGG